MPRVLLLPGASCKKFLQPSLPVSCSRLLPASAHATDTLTPLLGPQVAPQHSSPSRLGSRLLLTTLPSLLPGLQCFGSANNLAAASPPHLRQFPATVSAAGENPLHSAPCVPPQDSTAAYLSPRSLRLPTATASRSSLPTAA